MYTGCSKCYKTFERKGFNDKPDYSGWDYSNWVKRDGLQHKRDALETLRKQTKTSRAELESKTGVRYSELFRLPYFDPIRFHVIDPMHNLLLGTAKYTFKAWVETDILKANDLEKIDKRIKMLKLPSDMGRVSKCISKSYKSMKAEEWKHWILVYSIYCLQGILPTEHFNMWKMFVCACDIVLKRSITKKKVNEAHNLLTMFCSTYTKLFGKEFCTPNMHLHLHLKDCILDFGPIYGWWCMSFERFNGILGSYAVNNHNITVQLMRKFVSENSAVATFCKINKALDLRIPLSSCDTELNDDYFRLSELRMKAEITWRDLDFLSCETILSTPKKVGLYKSDFFFIENLVNALNLSNVTRISKFVKSIPRMRIGSEVFTTVMYRGGLSRSCNVLARYIGDNINLTSKLLRPGQIKQILELVVKVESSDNLISKKIFRVAEMDWFEPHELVDHLGKSSPVKLYAPLQDRYSQASFIPLKFVERRCIAVKKRVKFRQNAYLTDDVFFVIPLPCSSSAT